MDFNEISITKKATDAVRAR